jgi:CxxC motif-containing protein (DUF1111 family)
MRSPVLACIALGGAVVALSACSDVSPEVTGPPGTPLPGLSAVALERFERGKELFEHGWSPEEGLGPTYVQDRCTSCHDIPSSGGTSPEGLQKFAMGCNPLAVHGGDILQRQRTPLLIELGGEAELFPEEATLRPMLVPSMLYGLGLIEAIPEDEILSREDPDDLDSDGISGRAGRTADGRLARLGRKGVVASIVELVDAALITELGLTTPTYPTEETINGVAVPPESDPVPDPEIDEETIGFIADFIRYLAPIRSELPTSDAVRDTLLWGEHVFEEVGCATCHVPTLTTGLNAEPGLHERTIRLYSDLLLHDMGPEMAGLCGPTTLATEYRTEKLMGLKDRPSYMHDGRASGLDQAIYFHGGEAAASRDAFNGLDMEARGYLFRFLSSL